MKSRIRFPLFVVTVVLAASCGGGGAVPSAEGALPEAPPVPPPLEVPAPPPPTTGVSVETTVSVGAPVTTGSAATTATSTTTTTASSTTMTSAVSVTSTTAATTTTTVASPVTTTASVPEVWEYYELEDGTIVSVDGTIVSLEEFRAIDSSEEYTTMRIMPVPVLPASASEVGERDRLSAGVNYSCGLHWQDDSAECWFWGEPFRPKKESYWGWEGDSYDDWGDPSVETPEGGFAAVDAGREAACGLRPTGEVECWGANPLAEVPTPEGEFVSVSVGLEHACAIRPSGEVECWGTSPVRSGTLFHPEGEFTSIAAAYNFMCGLRPGGEVECWGVGYTSFADEEFAPPPGVFKAISAGGGDVCGLRPEGSVECWGNYDLTNEIGNWDITYLQPPEEEFASVVVGHQVYACGLKPDQTAECWSKEWKRGGVNVDGPPEGEKFIQVGVGHDKACGVRVDNTLLCWHSRSENNDRVIHSSEEFYLSEKVLSFEWGEKRNRCVLFLDGTVQCFGSPFGEAAAPPGVFTSVNVGGSHACGLRPSGAVECWGSNDFGEATPPEGVFTQVVASVDFSCGLRPTGEVECWGGGSAGRHSKVVAPRERLVFVDAGWGGHDIPWLFAGRDSDMYYYSETDWGYSCGLREDGSLLCWGVNDNRISMGEPLLSPPAGVFVDVGVGRHQACALRQNFTVECWGADGGYVYGEETGQGERFVSLEVGGWHACGLRSSGKVVCWDLTTQAPVLPSPITLNGAEREYSLISAGYFHVCGARGRGVDCWGPTMTRTTLHPLEPEYTGED